LYYKWAAKILQLFIICIKPFIILNPVIIIPARMASSRLPNKPLIEICGVSLIMRVYNKALQSKLANDVIVATDHQDIYDHIKHNGGKAMMTSTDHQSGTDRIAELSHVIDHDVIINVQGDEPLINPNQIDDLIAMFENKTIEIATQCKRIIDLESVFDFNIVKVVRDNEDRALYFSRQAIPAMRDLKFDQWPLHHNYFRHIGIYGFRKTILSTLTEIKPTSYEISESLEQLRWLQSGYKIHCRETHYDSIGVDIPEDVEKVENIIIQEMSR
jgi:3-deoxy-manno-octulosonate cytidylyltransferase (CMP-KDO synthetase)